MLELGVEDMKSAGRELRDVGVDEAAGTNHDDQVVGEGGKGGRSGGASIYRKKKRSKRKGKSGRTKYLG